MTIIYATTCLLLAPLSFLFKDGQRFFEEEGLRGIKPTGT